MAANTAPIYTNVPVNSWIGPVLAANTTKDLSAGTIYLVCTAGVNGSRIDRLQFQPLGTNVATAGRIWINNGGATGTAANNAYYLDVTLPISTVSEVASIPAISIQLDLVLQATYRIYVTVGTVVAAGYMVTAVGGNY